MKCEIYAKCDVNPTEDIDKVIKALSNLFDYDEIIIEENFVSILGGSESINNFHKELVQRKIRGAARKMMLKGMGTNKIQFSLSKQAAFVGVPNFVETVYSTLGEIEVEIRTSNVEKFIDWIAPALE
ncbi:MAG: hypothetical protein HZC47_07665 [Methanobacterium sp.]|uniref:RNA-binding domain-containing protein n=1 Tax=Methanobacterium sp. TaxID=2164 RepID=UPI003D650BB1|nr:hypothetical protein [Methanobacterium sp.]